MIREQKIKARHAAAVRLAQAVDLHRLLSAVGRATPADSRAVSQATREYDTATAALLAPVTRIHRPRRAPIGRAA